MSKNLTRKGLALGALVALATSVFAAAPAHATGESAGLLVAPNKGTTYTSIKGSTFDLKTVVAGSLTAANLSYLVTNAAGAPVKLAFQGSASPAATASTGALQNVRVGTSAALVGDSVDTNDATTSRTDKAIVVTGKSIGGNFGVDETNTTKVNHLLITSSTDGVDNSVYTVQAFLDANHDGLINNLDAYSAPVTVTFLPAANVTATTTITSATIGASTITAKVVLGNDVNMANLGTDVKVGFKFNGLTLSTRANPSASSGTTDAADVSWDGVDSLSSGKITTLTTDSTDSAKVIQAGTIVAQAYYKTSATKLGTASDAATPASSALSVDSTDVLDVKATADVLRTTTNSLTANAVTVRPGASVINFSSAVTWHSNDGTDIASPAGVSVKVTLSAQALDSASSFAAGGKTLTATSGDQTFYVLTDADGAIAFTGSGTGKTGDSVKVTITPLKGGTYLSASTNGAATVVTYATAIAQKPVLTDLAGASAELKATAGSSIALNYAVTDQYLQSLVTTSSYRLKVTTDGGTTGAAFLQYVPVTAGKATVTVADNSNTAGKYTITAQLEKLNATTSVWAKAQTAAGVDIATTDAVVNVNAIAASAVSAAATSSVAVATITKAVKSADLRVDNSTNTANLIGYGANATTPGAHHTISGVVTQASGAAVSGATVTIAGAGLGFVVNGNVYSVGTATINTGTSGAYSVDVYSNTAGKASVVVTSGAATKTVSIEFSGVTTTANTNVLTLDVPTSIQVGRAVTVTVKVVDKFGNPVVGLAPTLSLTGVGSLSSTAPAATDKTGVTTVQLVAGANDFGDASITAKYTGKDAAGADAVVSVQKTVTVGITDAQIDNVGKRVTAVASFSKGKTVGFYVDGEKKWSKVSTSDADVVVNFNLKKGRHTVTVKISGGFITSEVIVVK